MKVNKFIKSKIERDYFFVTGKLDIDTEYFINQTEKGIKSRRIRNWKFRGVIHPNFDELYEKFINTELCELCNVKLTEDKYNTHTTRVLDHCHESGEVRNIVCNFCNIRRG